MRQGLRLAIGAIALALLAAGRVFAQDATPPVFAGARSIQLECPTLSLQLSWDPATDEPGAPRRSTTASSFA